MQFSIERICYDFGKEQRIWFQDGLIEPLPEYSGGYKEEVNSLVSMMKGRCAYAC